ncbi:uncharacterized protein EV420DRAFT_1484230 [Desarmillaria tabescens]|uniref:Uncharacterized protein n=1 Tax=Armillaria tabescens TaxID=1929756 RepID=A0AA39JNN1_ARMTA|nr:uncharacterized protein EV420DRAFT_1484230 [Desarmillaria tabescens]KAK0446080.1 hypothetical protein EV420DRAFT_1484230 [Desarmillaria tabescens]
MVVGETVRDPEFAWDKSWGLRIEEDFEVDVRIGRGLEDKTIKSEVARAKQTVLQDLQLPPAFALPSTEVISRAIELAYERDFSHIPRWKLSYSVLDRDRKPLGYLDVAKLKQEWEAGKANPVQSSFTDYQRKFVLGVATSQDLEKFVSRRGF